MYEKVDKITTVLRLLGLLCIAGLMLQMFIPQRVDVDANGVTIRHLFTTRIPAKEIIGITERTSSKSGSHFYFLDTSKGAYEVADAFFMFTKGDRLRKQLGFSKFEVNERNIKAVYCVPKLFIDFRHSTQTESISYDFRAVKRAHSAEENFSRLYIALLLGLISFSIIVPSAYSLFHPEKFTDLFRHFLGRQQPEVPLTWARRLSAFLLLMGAGLFIFCNGLLILT